MIHDVPEKTSLKDFGELVEAKGGDSVVVVYYYAPWCPACRGVDADLAQKLDLGEGGAPVQCLKVDVEKCPELSGSVPAIPMFHVYLHGRRATALPIVGADFDDLRLQIGKIVSMQAQVAQPPPQPVPVPTPAAVVAPPADVLVEEGEGESDIDEDLAAALALSMEAQEPPDAEAPKPADGDAAAPAEPAQPAEPPKKKKPKMRAGVPVLEGDEAVDFMLKMEMLNAEYFKIMTEDMKYGRVRTALALHCTGNAGVDHACRWLSENENENTIEILQESPEQKEARIAKEQLKLKGKIKARREARAQEEKRAGIEREKKRRSSESAMRAAKAKYEVEQRKRERAIERKRAKEDARARKAARKKIAKDKLMRRLEGAVRRKETASIIRIEDELVKKHDYRRKHSEAGDAAAGSAKAKPAPAAGDAAAAAPATAPAPAAAAASCTVRVTLFDGSKVTNKFEATQTVKDLFAWVGTKERAAFRLQIRGAKPLCHTDFPTTLAKALGARAALTCVV